MSMQKQNNKKLLIEIQGFSPYQSKLVLKALLKKIEVKNG